MSDTNIGRHFAPHKPNCRCDDCHMERLQTQNMALKTKLAAAEADALDAEREKVRVLREALEFCDSERSMIEITAQMIARKAKEALGATEGDSKNG